MKYLLIPLALVAGSAFACPGDSSKDAMATPTSGKAVVAKKAEAKQQTAAVKAQTKSATKTASTSAKVAGL